MTTFTVEWTLQNKSLVVCCTSITKSTLIDGLHYLYTIWETACNIHGVWNEAGMNIDDFIDNNLMEIFSVWHIAQSSKLRNFENENDENTFR